MNIHQRIRQRREQLGLSMQALAKLIPVRAWQTIQQWEREDGTAPKRERLKAVAEALQTSEGWLLFGDQDTESSKDNKTNPNEKRQLSKKALQKWPFSVSPHDIDCLSPEAKQRLNELIRGFIEGATAVRSNVGFSEVSELYYADNIDAAIQIETPDGRVIEHIPQITQNKRSLSKKAG